MKKLRILGKIIKASGLRQTLVVFILFFFLAALFLMLLESSFKTYGDALWYCYEVFSTIGFGDFACTTLLGRIISVILSLSSILLIAVLTSIIVNYCTEVIKMHANESIAAFMDELEHLPELSPDELSSLSERVKKRRMGRAS